MNSIVAGNSDSGASSDIRKSPDAADAFLVSNSLIGRNNGTGLVSTQGAVADANGNLIGGATPQTALNPQLGPLQNNGGPTLTHAILSGSPAIDRGSNAAAIDVTNGNVALTTDQRGVAFARILDGDHLGAAIVDMGAVEFSGLRVTTPNPDAFALRPTYSYQQRKYRRRSVSHCNFQFIDLYPQRRSGDRQVQDVDQTQFCCRARQLECSISVQQSDVADMDDNVSDATNFASDADLEWPAKCSQI